MPQPANVTQRNALAKVRAWAKSKGLDPKTVRPQILKLYAPLTTTSDILRFNTDSNMSSGVATENLLKKDSVFFCNLIGLGLHKVQEVTGVKYPHNTQILHYPDKTIFADAAVAPSVFAEWGCVEAVYNGLLTMKTAQDIRLEDHPTNIFRSAPFTQSGAAAQPSTDLVLVDLNVSFLMSGQKNNQFSLSLGAGSDRSSIEGGAESNNYAVLLLSGFEVVDAARANIAADLA